MRMLINPLRTLRGISEAIKKYDDLGLMQQIVDLQTGLIESQAEYMTLADELRDAKAELDVRAKIARRGICFYMEGEQDLLYPVCWERDGKTVHAHRQ